MRFPERLIFALFIPALIALGNDIYLFFDQHVTNSAALSLDLIKEKFKFSAFGFIWTNYDPQSFKAVASSLAPETWAKLDQFLTIKAFYASLAFAGVIITLMTFLALFGVGPMAGDGGRVYGKGKDTPIINKKGTKMKYTRK